MLDAPPEVKVEATTNEEVWGSRDDRVADELAKRMGKFHRVPLFVQYTHTGRVKRLNLCREFNSISIILPPTERLVEDARRLSRLFGLPVEIVEPDAKSDSCAVTTVTEHTSWRIEFQPLFARMSMMRESAIEHSEKCALCIHPKSQPWDESHAIIDESKHMSISSRARQIPGVRHMSIDVYFCDECGDPVLVSETSRPGRGHAQCEVTHRAGVALGVRTVVLYANPASVGDGDDIRLEVVRERADFADTYFGRWVTDILPAVAGVVNDHKRGCLNLVDDYERPPTPTGVRPLSFGRGIRWGRV